MLILAHRGASTRALENTMDAFRHAIGSGCDGIEFDVHFCNGQALIIHDKNLLRTHQIDIEIALLNEEMRQRYHIPTLTQVLALLPADMLINIEIKSCDDTLFMQEYFLRLSGLGLLEEHVVISSFDISILQHLQTLSLPVRWGWLIEHEQEEILPLGQALHYDIVGISVDICTAERVKSMQQNGKSVWVFTLDEDAQWKRMLEIGVDGCFTNVPHAAVDWFRAR